MASVKVFNMEGKEVGTVELNDSIFAANVNEHLMHMAVISQLANKRQGTQSALTRAEVSGGGRKPYKQKGTGNARQGSTRAPQWRHGGIVFAPKPREYSVNMNRKERTAALKAALTSRVNDNKIIVIDSIKLDEIKTKAMVQFLDKFNLNKALVVLPEKDENVILSARNIADVRTEVYNAINVYDILKYENLVIAKEAVTKIEEVYA